MKKTGNVHKTCRPDKSVSSATTFENDSFKVAFGMVDGLLRIVSGFCV